MEIKAYIKKLRTNNTYNPFVAYIKVSSRMTRIPVTLYDDTIYHGKSATNAKHYAKHHIFDRNLFPTGNVGHTTPRILISQGIKNNTHKKFHKLIANAKCYDDFLAYEKAVKEECPEINIPIAQIYMDRIAQLPSNPLIWIACYFIVIPWLYFKRKSKNCIRSLTCSTKINPTKDDKKIFHK